MTVEKIKFVSALRIVSKPIGEWVKNKFENESISIEDMKHILN